MTFWRSRNRRFDDRYTAASVKHSPSTRNTPYIEALVGKQKINFSGKTLSQKKSCLKDFHLLLFSSAYFFVNCRSHLLCLISLKFTSGLIALLIAAAMLAILGSNFIVTLWFNRLMQVANSSNLSNSELHFNSAAVWQNNGIKSYFTTGLTLLYSRLLTKVDIFVL